MDGDFLPTGGVGLRGRSVVPADFSRSGAATKLTLLVTSGDEDLPCGAAPLPFEDLNEPLDFPFGPFPFAWPFDC